MMPIKVGDMVTHENISQLPMTSIIKSDSDAYNPYVRGGNGWYELMSAGNGVDCNDPLDLSVSFYVAYIGDANKPTIS